MFWQSCTSIGGSHLHVLPSLLCVFPPSASDPCALALGSSALTLASFPAALDVQKLHLIKTFILFPILLCRGCRHGSIAISLIDISVVLLRSWRCPRRSARCGTVLSAPLKESPYLYQMSRGGWPSCQASPGPGMTNVSRLKDYFLLYLLYWLNVVLHALPTALSPSSWCFVYLSGHIRPVLCGKTGSQSNAVRIQSKNKPRVRLVTLIGS